jgi:integrase
MHRGKRFWVSCRQLGTADTKEASILAANAWWRKKQTEIDAALTRPALPLEDLVAASVGKKAPLAGLDAAGIVFKYLCDQQREREREEQEEKQRLLVDRQGVEWVGPFPAYDPDDPEAEEPEPPPGEEDPNGVGMTRQAIAVVVAKLVADCLVEGKPLPPELASLLPPSRVNQVQEGLAFIRGEAAAAPEQTVQAYCDKWIDSQRVKVQAGQLSADGVDNKRICLGYFRDFIGGGADIKAVNAIKLQGFYDWCLTKPGRSADYRKKVFGTTRTFIRWLAEQAILDLPQNIDSRSFTFKNGPKAVPTWTPEEFQMVLGAATGQLRLHLLLMANCGLTQRDIADLKDSEVDWTAGRITRKRSKTRDQANVPTVSYPLWPATFALLRQYRSGGDLVLLTESGKSWKWSEMTDGGKLRHSDNIAGNYNNLKKRKLDGFKKPLKDLRKTSASLLETKAEYRGFSTLFLGHSPRSIADRHYVAPPQALFDQAVMWLGQQFGQVEPDPEHVKPTKASRGRG